VSDTLQSHGIENVSEIHLRFLDFDMLSPPKGDTIFFTRSVTPQIPLRKNASLSHKSGKQLDNIFFRDFDGRTLSLNGVPRSSKLSQVRKKLADEKGLDMDWVRFIWSGKQLEDNKTLEYYQVQEVCEPRYLEVPLLISAECHNTYGGATERRISAD
jgi:hypothetical protein